MGAERTVRSDLALSTAPEMDRSRRFRAVHQTGTDSLRHESDSLLRGTGSPFRSSDCPFHGADCPTDRTDCPFRGTDCPLLGMDCPLVGADCPFHGTDCPFHGADCPFRGVDCPFAGVDCPTFARHCPFAGAGCRPRPSILRVHAPILRRSGICLGLGMKIAGVAVEEGQVAELVRRQLEYGIVWNDAEDQDAVEGLSRAMRVSGAMGPAFGQALADLLADQNITVRTGAVSALQDFAHLVSADRLAGFSPSPCMAPASAQVKRARRLALCLTRGLPGSAPWRGLAPRLRQGGQGRGRRATGRSRAGRRRSSPGSAAG